MLEDIFGKGLNNRVAVYIPSTQNVDQALDESAAKQLINRALRFLSQLFGGATALPASGAWIAGDGTLVPERVTIVYAFAPELTREQLQAVKQFALSLKSELGQEAVSVEINGTLFFV